MILIKNLVILLFLAAFILCIIELNLQNNFGIPSSKEKKETFNDDCN